MDAWTERDDCACSGDFAQYESLGGFTDRSWAEFDESLRLLEAENVRAIPLQWIHHVQQRAVVRLHVWFTGQTHQMLIDFAKGLEPIIFSQPTEDDESDHLHAGAVFPIQETIEAEWNQFINDWRRLFERVRMVATLFPAGVVARYHGYYFQGFVEEAPSRPSSAWGGSRDLVDDNLLEEQLDELDADLVEDLPGSLVRVNRDVLASTAARVWEDGLQLSDRIWRLDRESRQGLSSTVASAINDGTNAWDLARRVESFLGIGQECPRWARQRLSQLSPIERAQSDSGLIRGPSPCGSTGVAYKALRLARNEIQIVHHAATDAAMARQPWVQGERVNLSPVHPVPDICDDIVAENPYTVGEVSLPLHVQCLCFKTAERMADADFTSRIRTWVNEERGWPEMDGYAAYVGSDAFRTPPPINETAWAVHLLRWAYGQAEELGVAPS